MTKGLVLFAVMVSLGTVGLANDITLGTFDVNPQATFLETSPNDSCSSSLAAPGCNMNPLIISLSSLDVSAGATLVLIEGGSECYVAETQGCISLPLGGVFDSSGTDLGAPNQQNRLPNQISTALPPITDTEFWTYPFLPTYASLDTDIPDDFYICGTVTMTDCSGTSGTTVVIPAGAQYLYVGVLDSFYADNTGDLTVTVEEIVSPEPATWMLLPLGAAVLAVRYGRRRRPA